MDYEQKPNDFIETLFEGDLQPFEYWSVVATGKVEQILRGENLGYSTGLKCLDKFVNMRNGEYVIIAAQSSMGKTALGLQIADSIANQIKRAGDDGIVAIFSAEMSGDSLVLRMASDVAQVVYSDFQDRRMSDKELQRAGQKMKDAIEMIHQTPIWIDDSSGPTTQQMLEKVQRLNESIGVKAIVFDFLELGGDQDKSEEQRIAGISRNLKAIAKKLNIPVIALSQLNDDANKRGNKLPQVTDLRYSRATAHYADVVILLMRPEYYLEKGIAVDGFNSIEDAKGKAFFIVGKQRSGRTGIVEGMYLAERMRFADVKKVSLSEY